MKMHLKMSSGKWQPLRLHFNVVMSGTDGVSTYLSYYCPSASEVSPQEYVYIDYMNLQSTMINHNKTKQNRVHISWDILQLKPHLGRNNLLASSTWQGIPRIITCHTATTSSESKIVDTDNMELVSGKLYIKCSLLHYIDAIWAV